MVAIWGRHKRGRYANPYNPFSYLNVVHIEQRRKKKLKKKIKNSCSRLKITWIIVDPAPADKYFRADIIFPPRNMNVIYDAPILQMLA